MQYFKWEKLVVPVMKPDGSVRLSGDYKVATNKVSRPFTEYCASWLCEYPTIGCGEPELSVGISCPSRELRDLYGFGTLVDTAIPMDKEALLVASFGALDMLDISLHFLLFV